LVLLRKEREGVMEHLNFIKVLSIEHEEIARDVEALQGRVERVLQQTQDQVLTFTSSEQELNEMVELVHYLHGKIHSHFYKEEQALFQVMEESLSDRKCTTLMREEHREILERCFGLLSLLHDWKDHLLDPEKVSKLQHLLLEVVNSFRSHIRREEQVLYPMAQICLRDEQREEIERRVKDIKLMA
jgi:hemerythrin-like domain-containing protein